VTQINANSAEDEKAKDEAAKAWLRRPVVGSTHDGKSFQLAGHDGLMHCVMTNNSEALNRLLTMDKYDLDFSPGNGQWTLLQTALQRSCLETASLLLQHGAKPTFASNGTPLPLELAKRSGQKELVALVQKSLERDTAPLAKLLTTREEVEARIESIVKEREAILNADVDFKLDYAGNHTSKRRYHVWLNDLNRRSDCRGVSSDGTEDYSTIVTPTFDWFDDHQDKSNSQFNRRDPKNPVGWGTLGCIVDVRKIGLVNWSIESIDTHDFDEDLLPKDRAETHVETADYQGAPITIVKLEQKTDGFAESWTEYWLSPAQGNYPIYIANGWTELDNSAEKYIVSQRTEWKLIDGIWFPTSVEHRYLCEYRNMDDIGTFELVAAKFNVNSFPNVFDPLEDVRRDGDDVNRASKEIERMPATIKQLNAFEARTLDDITSVYNDQTRQLRTELFTPPIPDLTAAQMRAAMLDAAEQYRKQGKVEIASALKTSAETNRLADRLTFMGMSGTMSQGFRQITPTFHFEVASNSLHSVILPMAELRYSLNGWSSKRWGDIHPPITGKWNLVSVRERGESLTEDAFNDWRKKHASWTDLSIDENSLTMAGDTAAKFDFVVDHEAGVLPHYVVSQNGETKFAGVLMGSGFVDDTTLVISVDPTGDSKPKAFQTKDGKTTILTYRRDGVAEIHGSALLKTDAPRRSEVPAAAQATEMELKIFQGHLNTTDRIVNAFKTAAASARKDGKPLNTLYLLAALMHHGSVPAIAETAKEKNIAMTDLMERCELAAQVSDVTSIEQWRMLAATAVDTAKQWKHDYLGTEHLLMALIAGDTSTTSFLREEGIEAAAIRDMAMQIYFSPDQNAPAIPPLPSR
jgi:hypothetical protein